MPHRATSGSILSYEECSHKLRRSFLPMAAGLLLAGTLAACADRPSKPLDKHEFVQVTANVEAVDLSHRLLLLRGPDGLATITVAPEVRNLEQVQVGDAIVVSYYEGIAAQMKKHGGLSGGLDSGTAALAAQANLPPAATVGQTVATTVTIESVDTSLNTVTFRRQDGFVRTLAVKSPEGQTFIRELSPGDEVDVRYTEAMAVQLVPAR
jgi:hypothetical protein